MYMCKKIQTKTGPHHYLLGKLPAWLSKKKTQVPITICCETLRCLYLYLYLYMYMYMSMCMYVLYYTYVYM